MSGRLRTEGQWIRDEHGRAVLLRGANLGGSSKVPAHPDGSTHLRESLYDPGRVSFVGRPFPMEAADEHFARLRAWGMGFVRLVVTWEAVEHAGPGIHDHVFLEYLRALVVSAGRHGLLVLIDPHQDAWSRWTGGDGAPAWTLTELGFRLETLHASGAACLHQELGTRYPRLFWPANYSRLGCATPFTLFWGGDTFAPDLRIRGEPAQGYLQQRYLDTWKAVAGALRGLDNVLGFGVMNEPSMGFIGVEDITRLDRATVRNGPMPTPLQAMAAGEGHRVTVDRWRLDLLGERRVGKALLNPTGARAWREGAACLWRRAGVWKMGDDGPRPVAPGHFRFRGSPTDGFLKPLATRFAAAVRSEIPDALIFVEGVPGGDPPRWTRDDPGNVVHAPHWYDGLTLVSGRYHGFVGADSDTRKFHVGRRAVRRCFRAQIARRVRQTEQDMAGAPTVIGEFGLPFHRIRDPAAARAFSAWFDALDANLVGAALWCYCADNNAAHGDHWNREDFSIYRRGAGMDGARGRAGFCRPYARYVAGTPIHMSYHAGRRRFVLSYRPDGEITAPTVVYVPWVQYPRGYQVVVEPAGAAIVRRIDTAQEIEVRPPGKSCPTLTVTIRPIRRGAAVRQPSPSGS